MKESILFINQSSGYLMIDIVNAYREQYEERILLAGLLNPRNTPLDEDVKVMKIIAYDRSSTLRRLFTWGWGFLQALFWIKWKYRKAHLFLVSNPPVSPLLPLLCRNTYTLLIYDVFPDALVEYSIFRAQSLFIQWWERANRKVYGRAERVFTLSEGMKGLMSKYLVEDKIRVVPVWTDNRFFQPIAKADNPFVREQGLEDKFIVLYSGNLGRSHDLQILVELAEEMVDNVDIFFLIIGGGAQYEDLKTRIDESHLTNIRLLPWQPTAKLPYTLAAANIGVVSLGKEAAMLSLPSKTFNLMSVGVPILAIADPASALADLIKKYSIGASFEPGQLNDIKNFIERTKGDKKYQYELSKGARAASAIFSPKNALQFLKTPDV